MMPVSHVTFLNKTKTAPRPEDDRGNCGSRDDDSATEICRAANQDFPPEDPEAVSDGDTLASGRLKARPPRAPEAFLQMGSEIPAAMELFLQHRLQVLREAHQYQLQEAALQHQLELESRMLHDALLSTGSERQAEPSGHLDRHVSSRGRKNTVADPDSRASRCSGPKHSSSFSDLRSAKKDGTLTFSQQRCRRPFAASEATSLGATIPQPFHMTLREAQKKPQVPQVAESYLEHKRKLDEIECQKKFHASPVPAHVFLPLYHNITEAREQARKAGVEQRRGFLLSTQKPFTFMAREEKKREERIRALENREPQTQTKKSLKVRTLVPKAVLDPRVGQRLIEQELRNKIRVQMRAQDLLKSSAAPINTQPGRGTLETSSTQRVRRKVLGFLNEKPTFKPLTNAGVPDFDRLHRAFQKETSRRAEHKEVTKCEPFLLRTSRIPPRQSRSPEVSQAPVSNTPMKRSHSFGGITSLSTDTLPTYITDAARRRGSAVRKSLEEKECKEQESMEWAKQHRLKSQAMRKRVTTRARAMDPHKSLKEVFKEKLKQNRELDSQRLKEYRKELEEMKTRVSGRPYLFEQVTKTNAKQDAERRYRKTLRQAGLDEQFVKRKGEKAKAISSLTPDEEDNGDKNVEPWRNSKENKVAEEEKEST